MRRILFFFLTLVLFSLIINSSVSAQTTKKVSPSPSASPSLIPTPSLTPVPTTEPRADLTEKISPATEPLRKILDDQTLGSVWPLNPIKYAIRNAVNSGVPINTLVLLLLLPGVAAIIAAARHVVGVRGFGILMPAALSVVFIATGPAVGIGIFLVIVAISIASRTFFRRTKITLQYLPRMALIMLFVVLGVLAVLFAAPIIHYQGLINVSIFPVLFLVLLAEDFTRIQLGKSLKVAVSLTTETLILALLSYVFLTQNAVQSFALLNPEVYILAIILLDFVMGKYVGLRFVEFWRFRKLISSK